MNLTEAVNDLETWLNTSATLREVLHSPKYQEVRRQLIETRMELLQLRKLCPKPAP